MTATLRAWLARQAPALRSAFATTLACELALLVVMALHLENPAWALITVLVLATPTAGSSVQKAMLRVVGTAVGAGLALVLIQCFDQAPLGFSLALAALCIVAAYGAAGTRYTYAYLIGFVTIVIIAMQGLETPHRAVDIAFARACEVGTGVAAAVLVRLSVWPVRSSTRLRAELAATLEQAADLLRASAWADGGAPVTRLIRTRQQHQTFLQAADGESDLTRAQHRRHAQAVARVGAVIDAVLAAEALAAAAPAPLLVERRAALAEALVDLAHALRRQRARGGDAIARRVAALRCDEGGERPAEGAGQLPLGGSRAALALALSRVAGQAQALARLTDYLGPGGPSGPAEIDAMADAAAAPGMRVDRARLLHAVKVAVVVVSALWLWMVFHLPGGMQGMVSAMIVAQRTVGATQVKGLQRLLGALLGGMAGILVASLLIPGVNSLGVFGLIVAPLLFAGAWLNDGSPTYGYIGFQANFAFVLTLVAGSSPEPNTLAPVFRVCGILIGVATASFILRTIAPIDAWSAALRNLGRLLDGAGDALAAGRQRSAAAEHTAQRDQTAALIAELRPGATRRGWPDWPLDALLALVSRLDALAGVLPVHGVTRESSVAAAVVAASARRLGADLVQRRVPSGAVDLAALRVQLEEAGAPPPLEQVGVLETAAILLAQIERSLVAHGAVAVPRPVAVSA